MCMLGTDTKTKKRRNLLNQRSADMNIKMKHTQRSHNGTDTNMFTHMTK